MSVGRGVQTVGEEVGAATQRFPQIEMVDVMGSTPGTLVLTESPGVFMSEEQTFTSVRCSTAPLTSVPTRRSSV